MTDIVERLRALVIMDEVGSDNPLGRDAADEIERLRVGVAASEDLCLAAAIEIDRLRAQVVSLQSSLEVGKREDKK